MKVVKVKNLYPGNHAATGSLGRNFYLHTESQKDKPIYPLGLVTISLPFKKGKRKLVKGYITAKPYTSQHLIGLHYEILFRPSNQYQLDKLKVLNPELF